MEVKQATLAGSAVFWSLGKNTDFEKLSIALKNAGFEKLLPEQTTKRAALRKALEEHYRGMNDAVHVYEVFPIRGTDGVIQFEVMRVAKSEGEEKRNSYVHIITATIVSDNGFDQLELDSEDRESLLVSKLASDYNEIRASVPYHSMAKALVEIVYRLNGVTLRPTGGIYWIPNELWFTWELVAHAFESAGVGNKMFALRAIIDENSAVVLREALANEINKETAEIAEILDDPDKAIRQADKIKARSQALQDKLSRYEQTFEFTLNDLRKAIDEATGHSAIAELLAAASDGPVLSFE